MGSHVHRLALLGAVLGSSRVLSHLFLCSWLVWGTMAGVKLLTAFLHISLKVCLPLLQLPPPLRVTLAKRAPVGLSKKLALVCLLPCFSISLIYVWGLLFSPPFFSVSSSLLFFKYLIDLRSSFFLRACTCSCIFPLSTGLAVSLGVDVLNVHFHYLKAFSYWFILYPITHLGVQGLISMNF